MYRLAYGKEELILPDEGLDVREVVKIKDLQPLDDPVTAVKNALSSPIDAPPLKELIAAGETVAIIVNDDTRVANTAVFLPVLLEEIESCDVAREDISIVFANGTHRLLPEETQRQLIGSGVYEKYRVINHDCRDKDNLTYLGVTSRGTRVEINRRVAESDRVILTGSILYHFFAGYGGGRKALVPGVVGYETIMTNHSLMLNKDAASGKLTGNPIHEDIMEAVRLVEPDFLLNVVLNDRNNFLGIFAGHYEAAHAAGCRLVDQAYSVQLRQRSELVIASCGGHPKDINLYQAHKTLENAVRAVLPGGVVILLAACPEGLGSDVMEEWLDQYNSPAEIFAAIKKKFVLGGHKAYTLSRLTNEARIIMLSELPDAVVRKIYFTPAGDLDEALALARKFLNKEKPLTCIMPQGSLTLPFESMVKSNSYNIKQ